MRKQKDAILLFSIYLAAVISVLLLIGIIVYVFMKGAGVISWDFLTQVKSTLKETEGIAGNILNTVYIVILTLLVAAPIGIGSAIYLNEYAHQGPFVRLVEFTTQTLSGIPSILFGLFGMIFFGNILAVGRIVGESAALLFTAGSGHLLPNSAKGYLTKILESGGTLTIELYLSMSKADYDVAFGIALVLVVIVFFINLFTKVLIGKWGNYSVHLQGMIRAANELFSSAIDAFVESDMEASAQVIKDEYIDMLMLAKYLEKIGDHAVNIAKWQIFRVEGELV